MKIREQLADAAVFGKGRKISTLRQDVDLGRPRYTRELGAAVKTNMSDATEASKILEEIKKIDVSTLGKPKAIGLKLKWSRDNREGNDFPAEYGEVLLFLGKS